MSSVDVRPDDIDLFGHVHSSKYLDYFLAARFVQMQENYGLGIIPHLLTRRLKYSIFLWTKLMFYFFHKVIL
jgi:hypothetical protein